MNSPYEEFERRLQELNNEIFTTISRREEGREVILDGPINRRVYYDNKPKVLWLMKEPYDTNGGGWDYETCCKDLQFRRRLAFGQARATWQPIIYIAHSIRNQYIPYNAMDSLSKNHSMLESLDTIAWVNIQKLPSKNITTTDMAHVSQAARMYSKFLLKQIEVLDPDVIICGGTVSILKGFYPDIRKVGENGTEYLVSGKRLIIPAYHPAQRTMKRELYVDSLVGHVKYWSER